MYTNVIPTCNVPTCIVLLMNFCFFFYVYKKEEGIVEILNIEIIFKKKKKQLARLRISRIHTNWKCSTNRQNTESFTSKSPRRFPNNDLCVVSICRSLGKKKKN